MANQAVIKGGKMGINHQAPLSTHKEIFVQASPEVVCKVHTAINDWSQWQPNIDMAKQEDGLTVGSKFEWKSGGLTINSVIQILEPEQQIGWTGKSLGTNARHIWKFKAQDDGTLLTTEESMEGWLISILKLIMPKFLEESLDTWLQSLKIEAERNSSSG
jgi:hypothetical protein